MLQEPIKKNNKLISIYKNPPTKNITDVKIKAFNKLFNNNGYYLNIYISPQNNNDIINELLLFDKEIISEIEKNSLKWFNTQFDISEITELYNKSLCNQTKTISIILTKKHIKSMLYNNKKITEIEEIIKLLNDNSNKKCLINISIEYYGLYIYSETTSNKWVITKIDITNIDDEESIVSIDELIDNYIDRTNDINIKSKIKLQELTNDIENIKKNMKDIDNIMELLDNKDITNKTRINNNLIKLNELILKQETIIKTSHL
jgi:hypothetical protein